MPSSTAVFRAVADFASLNREVKGLKREFKELKAEAADTGPFKSFDSALARTAKAQQSLRSDTVDLTKVRQNLGKAERSLAEDIGRSTRARKDATAPAKTYERSLTTTEQAMQKLHATQQKARQSTDSLTNARNKSSSSLGDAADRIANLAKAETDAVGAARSHADALKREKSAVDSKLGSLNKLSALLADLTGNERDAASGSDTHSGALGREAAALGDAANAHRSHTTALNSHTQATNNSTTATTGFNNSVRQSGPASNSSRSSVSSLGQTLRNYAKSADNAGGRSHVLRTALLGLAIPAIPAVLQVLVGAVIALGGALVGIVGALGPAAAGLAALGPAALTAATAVGTVMLAFRGVKAALKAQSAAALDASKSSTNSAQQQVQNARRIRDAQEAITAAVKDRDKAIEQADRDVAAAEKDVARAHDNVRDALAQLNVEREKAIRDLEDYNNAAKDAALSVESAEISLIDAQQNQLKVNADAKSTDLDRRKAALQVAEAEQRLSEAKLDNKRAQEQLNTANAEGVDGAPGVVAAQKNIADANDQVSQTQANLRDTKKDAAERIAAADEAVDKAERNLRETYEDVALSADKASAAQTNLAAAMAKLSPAGVAFVNYLRSLQPLIDNLSKSAQQALFPGLQRALEIIMPMINTVAIPTVNAFGAVLSKLAVDGAQDLRSFEKDFLDFGTGDGPVLMDKFGHTLLNLALALEDIVMAAMPLAQWLADLALKFSQYIRDTTEAARNSGRLAEFFNKVKDTLKLLGDILFNVGGILFKVFQGAAPMGKRLLETFRDVTAETNKYLHTAEGIAAVKKYFDDMEPSVRIIFSLLSQLAKALLGVGASKGTYDLLKLIQDQLVPALSRMAKAFGEISGPLGAKLIDMLSNFADILAKLFGAGGAGLEGFVTVLDAFSKVLLFILGIPGMDKLGSWLFAIAAGLTAIKLVGKIPAIGAIGRGLNTLGGSAARAVTGQTAVKESPSTFTKGLAGAVGGATAAPKTATAALGAAIGSGVRKAAQATPGVRNFVGPAAKAPVTVASSGPVTVQASGGATVASPRTSVVSRAAGAVGGAASAVGRTASKVGGSAFGQTALSVAGSVGGAVAGGAIGQAIGGDTGAMVGSLAGSVAGSFAPDAIAAGVSKIGPLVDGAKAKLGDLASTLSGAVAGAAKSAAGALGSIVSGAGSAIASLSGVIAKWIALGVEAALAGVKQAASWVAAKAGAAVELVATLGKAALGYVAVGAEALIANGKQLLFNAGALIVRGALLAWAAAQWVLNAALNANPIGLIILLIAGLVAGFIYAWTHSEKFREIVTGALQAVGDFFKWIWDNALKPIFDLFVDGLHLVGDAAMWLWNNAIKPALDAIGAAATFLWNYLIKPTFDNFVAGFHAIGDAAGWLWNNIIKPAWDGIGAIISGVYNNILKPIFDGFMYVVHLLADSFNVAIEAIKVAWNKLGDIAKIPVNFVIDWVYNRGIVPMWNGLAGLFGLGQLKPAALLAEGGVLPGYAPGRDTVPAVLSPGEGVLVPEAVQGLGPNFVYEANAHFSRGRARKGSSSNRFALGGIVGDIGGAIATMVTDPVGSIKRLFSDVLSAVIPGSGQLREAMVKVPVKVVDAIVEKAKEYAASAMAAVGFGSGGGSVEGGGTAGTERWRAVALQALGIAGQDPTNIGRLLMQMSTESGGNPSAINRYDINWQKGTPSVGLMQVIGPTYSTYHHPSYNAAPFEYGVSEDPLSNILSSIRYTLAAYGSLARGWQGHGYAKGGVVTDAFGNFPPQLSRKRKSSLGQTPTLHARKGSDSVAAMLTPGEFVLNRKAVLALGIDKLQKLNDAPAMSALDLFSMMPSTVLPHYAMGGLVKSAFNSSVTNRAGNVSTTSSSRDVVINTNIYNPTAEPASDSVASRMRTLSLMGAFS